MSERTPEQELEAFFGPRPSAPEPIQRLGIVVGGSLSKGLEVKLDQGTVIEGLAVGRYLGLGMREKDTERIRKALIAVALDPDDYLHRYVDESLSGGERKRVELAAVYAMRTRLAILDEPDSGIDIMTLEDIARLIRRLRREGTTVLLISHRDEVVAIADVASLICEGRIQSTGAPGQVCDRYARCCRPCDRAQKVETEFDYERL